MRYIGVVFAATVVVSQLAGCGGDADDQPSAASDLASSPSDWEDAVEDSEDVARLETIRSTLFGHLGTYMADYTGVTDEEVAGSVDQQEAIAGCMEEAGFDYVVVPFESSLVYEEELDRLGLDDFFAEYGFGIASLWEREEIRREAYTVDGFPDPNADIRADLGPEEQAAYDQALYGEGSVTAQGEVNEASGAGLGDEGLPEGCLGEGILEVNPYLIPRHLGEGVTDVREAIDADSDLLEVEEAWSDCMEEAGYDFETVEDAYYAVQSALDELLYEAVDTRSVEGTGHSGEPVEVTIPRVEQNELDEVEAMDRNIGGQTHDCAEAVDLLDVQREVELRHQLAYVEENESEIVLHDLE